MNENNFPFIAINYASDKDSDFSEKEYKKKNLLFKNMKNSSQRLQKITIK